MIKYTFKNLITPNNFYFKNAAAFVKQKEIDEISKNYGTTKWEKTKMYGVIFKHIALEGFKGFKDDFKLFRELKKKQILNDQETSELMRINQDILKMGPLIIIDILPFTGPLFMLYMYTYPGSIPSWFLIDYYHDRHQQLKVRNQKKNLIYFQQKGFLPQNIDVDKLSLRELRKLTLLLFGFYRDGTIGYRKFFNKKISYFLFEGFSRFLLKRDLQKKFRRDLFCNKITNNMSSLNEMMRWRYGKIMNGEYLLQYKPLYEQTIQKMEKISGEQSQIFAQIEKQQKVNHKTTEKQKENKKI